MSVTIRNSMDRSVGLKEVELAEYEGIEESLEIVERFAAKLASRSWQPIEIREELRSVGTIAVITSHERYASLEENHRIKALSLRIRGAMLDYLSHQKRYVFGIRQHECDMPAPRQSNPEYRYILGDIRRKLEDGYQELNADELLILKNILSRDETSTVRRFSASHRTKIKQQSFKKLRKYILLSYKRKDLIDLFLE